MGRRGRGRASCDAARRAIAVTLPAAHDGGNHARTTTTTSTAARFRGIRASAHTHERFPSSARGARFAPGNGPVASVCVAAPGRGLANVIVAAAEGAGKVRLCDGRGEPLARPQQGRERVLGWATGGPRGRQRRVTARLGTLRRRATGSFGLARSKRARGPSAHASWGERGSGGCAQGPRGRVRARRRERADAPSRRRARRAGLRVGIAVQTGWYRAWLGESARGSFTPEARLAAPRPVEYRSERASRHIAAVRTESAVASAQGVVAGRGSELVVHKVMGVMIARS
ncbi:hypothetical protein AMAG_20298 [Allomyces macrogynus ATCC 38327]|uniref:Uncharacterized protein n=1 Tax=Allomyces macrogynus (strain ATCC 38327) TaxID=578462 RepID=A0A0L0T7B0_ALLM3|nr:hypothetical protein AMAG_20298 [Allomyces macrogynus ATCC 38327]|eukprot:KNE70615.1 hypothetical protein AMAG_20298 [Allomyces macrogynus ATCC 38327]